MSNALSAVASASSAGPIHLLVTPREAGPRARAAGASDSTGSDTSGAELSRWATVAARRMALRPAEGASVAAPTSTASGALGGQVNLYA